MANKKLITGVILAILGIVFISHGNTMNNDVMANFARAMGMTGSLGKAGFLDKYPGAIWIIIGTIAAIIGVILLIYHFSGKKLPIDSLLKLLQPKLSNLPDQLQKPLLDLLKKMPQLTGETDDTNEEQIEPLKNEDSTEVKSISPNRYIKGTDGKVNPNGELTRAEAIQIFCEAMKFTGSSNVPYKNINNHWAINAIQTLYAKGYLKQFSDNELEPDKKITRIEFIRIAYLLLADYPELKNNMNPATNKTNFIDLHNKIGDTLNVSDISIINEMYSIGLITGTGINDLFKPDDTLTRAECIKLINKLIGNKNNLVISNPFCDLWNDNREVYNDILQATVENAPASTNSVKIDTVEPYSNGVFIRTSGQNNHHVYIEILDVDGKKKHNTPQIKGNDFEDNFELSAGEYTVKVVGRNTEDDSHKLSKIAEVAVDFIIVSNKFVMPISNPSGADTTTINYKFRSDLNNNFATSLRDSSGILRYSNNFNPAHIALDLSRQMTNSSGDIVNIYPGKVVFVTESNSSYGNRIVMEHELNGIKFYSLYAHLSKISVSERVEIKLSGEKIGIIGSSGNTGGYVHLHFAIWRGDYSRGEGIPVEGNLLNEYSGKSGNKTFFDIRWVVSNQRI